MKIGYARVSTLDQNPTLQIEALEKEGCEKIFIEKGSGSKELPCLLEAIEFARAYDTLVVWKLDRLSRSLKHLITTVNLLGEKKIGLKCITQPLDTTNPTGMLIFHIFGAIAEFEKELIKERTLAGIKSARARGRLGGRPKRLLKNTEDSARHLYKANSPVKDICSTLNISKSSLYRILRAGAPQVAL